MARLWLIVVLSLLAMSAGAQTDQERERALELGREALALYNEQRWVEAHDRFEDAERLVHSPVFVLYMARAKKNLGALLRARELYRRVEAETLADDAPEPWRDAKRDAADELASVERSIVTLHVAIEGEAAGIEVSVDGRRLSASELAAPVELDPGKHLVTVRHGDAEVARRHLDLAPGAQHRLPIRIAPPPPRAAPAPPPAPPPPAAPRESSGGRDALRAAGIAGIVLGGIVTAVGVGLGILAINLDGDLEEQCVEGRCPERIAEDVQSYRDAANAATGTLIAGGVLLAGGITMTAVAAAAPSEQALSLRLVGSF